MMPKDTQAEGLRAKKSIYRLLSLRLRSEQEIRAKLTEKKFESDTIDQTVQYFQNIGLIDDRVFTKKWIAFRLAKPFGIHRITYELKLKGISDTIINEELALAFQNYSELDSLRRLIEKQIKKYQGIDPLKKKQRLYQFLTRRGFSQNIINQMIKSL